MSKVEPSSSNEYGAFVEALGKVLRVSHAEMKERVELEKKAKAAKPRPRSSSRRACGDKG